MFCPNCGNQLSDDAKFCASCGAQITAAGAQAAQNAAPAQDAQNAALAQDAQNAAPAQDAYQNVSAQNNAYQYGMPPVRAIGFGEAIKNFFTNYANFSGRATRSEFWFAYLFNFLVGIVAVFIPFIGWMYPIATFVPNLAIAWRRLHDIGKSGGWFFMILIPFAGPIILLVQYCKDSDADNQYGPRII